MRYVESLNRALSALLHAHPEVCLLGEDLSDPYGGAFKVSRGLSSAYPRQVISTPISEASLAGVATGMALRGMKPVLEIMFGDFLSLCLDPILNSASKFHWMFNSQVNVPLVIRTPMGGRRGYGPTHSQSLESLFMSVPQLRILAASRYHDPGALLQWAVLKDPQVTLFIENKLLYPQALRSVGTKNIQYDNTFFAVQLDSSLPLISLSLAPNEKPDIVLICYGGMADLALEAALVSFEQSEILVEILLPAQIHPLDLAPILPRVSLAQRVLLVEEGPLSGGWGAETAARLQVACWQTLKAPILRVAAKDLPVPSAPSLEKQVLPQVQDIVQALYKLKTGY